MIISCQGHVGNKWADIAKLLPGRTSNNVKNRWYNALMKQTDPHVGTMTGGGGKGGGGGRGGGSGGCLAFHAQTASYLQQQHPMPQMMPNQQGMFGWVEVASGEGWAGIALDPAATAVVNGGEGGGGGGGGGGYYDDAEAAPGRQYCNCRRCTSTRTQRLRTRRRQRTKKSTVKCSSCRGLLSVRRRRRRRPLRCLLRVRRG